MRGETILQVEELRPAPCRPSADREGGVCLMADCIAELLAYYQPLGGGTQVVRPREPAAAC